MKWVFFFEHNNSSRKMIKLKLGIRLKKKLDLKNNLPKKGFISREKKNNSITV